MLRPGGHFLYTDCQAAAGVEVWKATLVDAPLRKLSQRDINAETMRGMEMHSQHWVDTIDRRARRPSCATLFATAPRWPAGSTTRA